jgi:transcriptional regulator with XRE-family HTH domain
MGKELTQEQFVAEVTARTKQAREDAGFTQAQIAKLLDLEVGTYHKYECRTPMPHLVMIKFCVHTNVLIQELFHGKAHAAVTVRVERNRRASRSS